MKLVSLIKFFRGYVRVALSGFAPERFLNLCGNRNILLWDLKPTENGYCFCISISGFRMLKPLLKKTRTKIKILERIGLPFFFFRYRKRKLFAAGFVLGIAALYYFSGFIWNIEVNGNSYLSEQVLLEFLAENDAGFGSPIRRIDCGALEEELRMSFDEVIWTSVKIYGTKLTVDIQESLLSAQSKAPEDDVTYDIAASKDGTVTGIVTRSGKPLVSAGAEVKKGDLLISGCIELVDDNDEVVDYLYHSADADISADVTYDYLDLIEEAYVKKEPTGTEKTRYCVQLFSLELANPFWKEPSYPCDCLVERSQLKLTRNFYLPIYLKKTIYSEYEQRRETHTAEEIRRIANSNFALYLRNLQEKGIQILEKNVMIRKIDGTYVVNGTVTANESIVSYRPTEIITVTEREGQQTDESD